MQHRYYGKSIPFGGNEHVAFANATTLGYLSSTQALADFAVLITDLKKNLTAEESPVVVLGGSYGGSMDLYFYQKTQIYDNSLLELYSVSVYIYIFFSCVVLAAWFRLKYPHIAVGAVASSAPILQFDDIISPYTFNNIITNDFRVSLSNILLRFIKNSYSLLTL